MTFRVRTSLFGKAILQIGMGDDWKDSGPGTVPAEFEVVSSNDYRNMVARIERYERRAAAQRQARREK